MKVISMKRTRIAPPVVEAPRGPNGGHSREVQRQADSGLSRALAAQKLLPLGLGDVVEKIAKPIAREIDGFTADLMPRHATHLNGCSACSKRRHFLNRIVGDVWSLRQWLTAWRRVRPAYRAVWGCRRAA
jgi:hypothetical protein